MRPTLAFPWPSRRESAGPAVRMVVQGALWQAVARRTVDRWRRTLPIHLPVVGYTSVQELPTSDTQSLTLVEVDRVHLLALASWISEARGRKVVALLARGAFSSDDEQQAARRLLTEAGAWQVVAEPAKFVQSVDLFDDWWARWQQTDRPPLHDLPLRCWGPAWQADP